MIAIVAGGAEAEHKGVHSGLGAQRTRAAQVFQPLTFHIDTYIDTTIAQIARYYHC